MRIVVRSWDENNIYGTTVGGEKHDVTIPYNIQNAFGNWQYIGKLLSEGCRLNIVEDELFIFEPDCLVDISSVAGCFEDYGVNPYNYLLSKLRPAANNRYIMLGNLAGQMLEEEINFKEGHRPTYAETITRFFHRNALAFATCPDLNNADPQVQKATVDAFHKEARQQQQNIRGYILGGDLFQQHYFDINKVLLEPTFVCEELGVQGRMDLVQSDLHLLIEQKSGSKNRRTNNIQLKHHVQVMLYFAVLHYSHGIRFGECSCSLLYSRYPGAEGIVKARRSPELLFQALMIRNQIVWNEFSFSRPDGIRILDRITPDKLRRGEPDRNWYQYTEPELSALLALVHEASMLARSYFYRMFQFVQKENLLAKMGNETPLPGRTIAEGGGFALTWLCSLAEKREAGNIYDSLQLLSHTEDSVTFTLDTSTTDTSSANFRVGDSVILYKYKKGEEPDARRAILLRASIYHLNAFGVELSLSNSQRNAIIFATDEDECWAIEHDYMDSSYTALYRGLYASLSMSKDRSRLLLSQRKPKRTVSRKLRGEYGRFNPLVEKCLQADDYAIIIGPPGTGKTSFGMLNVLKEHLMYKDEGVESRVESMESGNAKPSNVLIVSFTNRAVEEVCSKLVEEGIDFIRLGNIHACSEAYHPYMLSRKAEACATVDEVKRMVESTRVFVSTTSSISNNPSLFRIKHFDLCIVDEASQILEPHLMALIAAQQPDSDAPAIDKFVFIGDHKQLPAVVQQNEEESEVQEKELREMGLTNCRLSLFERLLRNQTEWMAEEGRTLDDSPFVFRLNRQGRMHPEVSAFANEEFYEGNLMPVPLPHQKGELGYCTYDASDTYETMLATCRTRFIDVEPTGDSPSDKVNLGEAREVARIVVAAYALYARCGKAFVPEQTLGIIVPYRNQISAVRSEIQHACVERFAHSEIDAAKAQEQLLRLSIDTVERYQGSQRDIILYSFTIRAPYQIDFLTSNTFVENGCVIDRKLNVALTRAREQMFLVGNKRLLSQNEVFLKLINKIS